MGKKNKSSQFPPPKGTAPKSQPAPQSSSKPAAAEVQSNPSKPNEPAAPAFIPQMVQPEQMSLNAHKHIQSFLDKHRKETKKLTKEDLNAVLRLSQHLRVFGLLSAVGYLNQSNAQGGEVRGRTVPVWESLLGQLIDEGNPPERGQLMTMVVRMTADHPAQYLANWRRSLVLANHWNFWARAYQEDKCTPALDSLNC